MNGTATTATLLGTREWPLTGVERVSRKSLKTLRRRTNVPGLLHLAVHVLALVTGALLVHVSLGTWLVVPAMLIQGVVIVLLFAPLHECSHFTAFRSRWLNHVVGISAAIVTMRPFFYFKWRHAEHHTFTQHEQKDPDRVPFPSTLREYLGLILGVEFWPKLVGTLWRGVTGRFTHREREFIPESEFSKVSWEIRLTVLLYALIVVVAIAVQSWAIVIYWLLPRVIGEPVLRAIRMAEHTGAEESPDLLRNTRTTLANPAFRILYWNMPYHAEHHLASSVPFHALPELHAELRPHLANVASGYWAVHRDIVAQVLSNQRARH
ncbi:MAG: fatty acid desaturase [Burkholderiaceae bacterium]|nr:fatty acid desaturase [Burkholderiaceae bacterium]